MHLLKRTAFLLVTLCILDKACVHSMNSVAFRAMQTMASFFDLRRHTVPPKLQWLGTNPCPRTALCGGRGHAHARDASIAPSQHGTSHASKHCYSEFPQKELCVRAIGAAPWA